MRCRVVVIGMRVAVFANVIACAPPAEVNTVAMATPDALGCDSIPTDIQARLWVSGSKVPCELVLNIDAGTTTGSCDAAPGRVRTLTLDWFLPSDRGVDVLLAQATGEVNLEQAQNAEEPFAPSALVTSDCRDMHDDQVVGSSTVTLDGVEVPPCDLDKSCAGVDDGACSNLSELCAGGDPFDPLD